MDSKAKKYTFIDLFAGIGGFHLALHNVGAECVFASEIDENARKTYRANFKELSPNLFENDETLFNKDITKQDISEIPDFDILCGGFPCQPFSNAGFKKGFSDTRGTLFFNIAEIISQKQPQAFFLENVRGLFNHDNGKTFETIKRVITEDLGYSLFYKIVKASDYGLPQARPRLYMVGFKDTNINFSFPDPIPLKYDMSFVMGGRVSRKIGFTLRCGGRGSKIHDRRNWDCYLVDGKTAQLNPKQGLLMQGFPEDFIFPVSQTQAMKQLGNSVAVDAIQATVLNILKALDHKDHFQKTLYQANIFDYANVK
jgi:DNA (cytosine-5)-methyltransferase 1